MNIFITGVSGYIGRVVAEKLQTAGHHITGLARSDEAAWWMQTHDIEPRRGDLFDTAALQSAAREADAVIHLAAMIGPGWGEGDRAAVYALLDALEGSGKPFVYTSGVPIYGDTGPTGVTENAPLNPSSFFAWRPSSERIVSEAAQRAVRSIIVRPATVFGRGGSSSLLLLIHLARQNGVARYIGSGENRWSSVYIDDLADLFRLALEQAAPGALFNASAGQDVSMKELALAISTALGREGAASWTLEQARAVLGPRADSFSLNQCISSVKATTQLGWRPQGPSILDDVAYGSYKNSEQPQTAHGLKP